MAGLGRFLTAEEIAWIRELRYQDGYSCRQVAEIIGCSAVTVRQHAPGRPGKVPVAPLREAFLASPMSAADVARELGWWACGFADAARVKRTLGLLDDISGRTGQRSRRMFADAEVVQLIAEAIGVPPWSVLPDEESEAA